MLCPFGSERHDWAMNLHKYINYTFRDKKEIDRQVSTLSDKMKRGDSYTDGRLIEEEHAETGHVSKFFPAVNVKYCKGWTVLLVEISVGELNH